MRESRDHEFQEKYEDPGIRNETTFINKAYHPLDDVPTRSSTCYQISSVIISNQHLILRAVGLSLFSYFFCMDVILFSKFRTVDFANEPKDPVKPWSPFRPLSMKLLMSDHMTHYVITPLSEGFNDVTRFSEVFYFITPNMISFTHMIVGFIMSRFFIISSSLTTRRIGVLLGIFRFFLDAFDGTVYRSRSSNKSFRNDHSSIGYLVDTVADTGVSTALCFALWYYLGWKCPPASETAALPSTWHHVNGDKEAGPNSACENHVTGKPVPRSKLYLFWRMLLVGILIAVAAASWDNLMTQYAEVYMKKLSPGNAAVQLECFHSLTTWVVIWSWKVLQGQTICYMLLAAIFLDKIWEFLQFIKYLGWVLVFAAAIFSYYHLNNVRQLLHL